MYCNYINMHITFFSTLAKKQLAMFKNEHCHIKGLKSLQQNNKKLPTSFLGLHFCTLIQHGSVEK